MGYNGCTGSRYDCEEGAARNPSQCVGSSTGFPVCGVTPLPELDVLVYASAKRFRELLARRHCPLSTVWVQIDV